ncbi:uncharacterized protein LOC121652208 [Melanotaenia boesemani]|uniref:uncharacterized protein LOC121652208 n=1 Tax=Melanotaenia boesemani TaxID=1250792 RepID=UPI001C03B30A|nr:uncharacterized protein LOC121652208 [Melanotaenia boesemani]
MKNFLNKFPFQKVSIFITVVSFTYNVVLDRDLECTCNEDSKDCGMYMGLPYFIFFVLMLCTDKVFPSSCRYVCTRENTSKCSVCGIIFLHIFKALFIAGLWSISVLMDGDWYVCCRNDLPKNQTQLPCKVKTTLTTDEQEIIAGLKNKSRNFGSIFFAVVCLAALMSVCDWRCCKGKSNCCKNIYDWCDRTVYDELILEESEDVLMEVLSKAAKNQMKEAFKQKIEKRKWPECFDVVQEIIKNSRGSEPPENEILLEPQSTGSGTGTQGRDGGGGPELTEEDEEENTA